MSLDVSLHIDEFVEREHTGVFVRESGRIKELTREELEEKLGHEVQLATVQSKCVFDWNITHNLSAMAAMAGLYEHLWRPEEVDATLAWQLIPALQVGLAVLVEQAAFLRGYNPPNQWGRYEDLVEFVEQYLYACETWPGAKVVVSR